MISATEASLPDILSWPSITRAGVLMTPYLTMAGISYTFATSAFVPLSYRAFFTFSYSALHLAQPVPSTSIFMISLLYL